MLLALPFGLAIGLSLGALGGGGAVVALPVLVYVLGQDVHSATTGSLAVVVAAALAAGTVQASHNRVCWPQVGVFVPAALAGAVIGTLAGEAVSGTVLLIGFVPVLFAAAAFTWRRADGHGNGEVDRRCPALDRDRALVAGFAVGALTGFFGVGGGFLVVPMLVLAMGFPLRAAIGTALVIVGFVSLAGLSAHLLRGSNLGVDVAATMAVACALGAVAGARFSERLPQRALAHGFSVLLTVVGAYMLVEAALFGGPPGA